MLTLANAQPYTLEATPETVAFNSPQTKARLLQAEADGSSQFTRGIRSASLQEDVGFLADQANRAFLNGDEMLGRGLEQQMRDKAAQAQQWAPTTQNFTDVNSLGSAVDWATGSMGQGLRSTLLPAASSLAGAGAGALTGIVTKNPGLGVRVGAGLGGFLGGYNMEANESLAGSMLDPQIRNNKSMQEIRDVSRGKGAVAGALEAAVPAMLIGKGLGVAGRVAKGDRLANIGRVAGQGALGEFATEGAQDVTGQVAENYLKDHALGNIDPLQAFNAGMAGAVAGGGMGAIGGAAQSVSSAIGTGADKVGEIRKDPIGAVTDGLLDLGAKVGTGLAKGTGYVSKKFENSFNEESALREKLLSEQGDEASALGHAQRIIERPDASESSRQDAASLISGQMNWQTYRDKRFIKDEEARRSSLDDDIANEITQRTGTGKQSRMSPTLTDDFGEQEGRDKSHDNVTNDMGDRVKGYLSVSKPGGKSAMPTSMRMDIESGIIGTDPQRQKDIEGLADIWRKQGVDNSLIDASEKLGTSDRQSAIATLGWVARGFTDVDGELFVPESFTKKYKGKSVEKLTKAVDLAVAQGLLDKASAEKVFPQITDMAKKQWADQTNVIDTVFSAVQNKPLGRQWSKGEIDGFIPELRRMAESGTTKREEEFLLQLFGSKEGIAKAMSAFKEPKAKVNLLDEKQKMVKDSDDAGDNEADARFDSILTIDEPKTRAKFQGRKQRGEMFNTKYDSQKDELTQTINALNDAGGVHARSVGILDAMKEEFGANHTKMREAENEALWAAVKRNGSTDEQKKEYLVQIAALSPAQREQQLKELNRTMRKIRVEHMDTGHVGDTIRPDQVESFRENDEPIAVGDKKDGTKVPNPYVTPADGMVYLERKVPGSKGTVDPETGEVVAGMEAFKTSTIKLMKHVWAAEEREKDGRTNGAAGKGAKGEYEATLRGLSALLNSDDSFTGRVGFKRNPKSAVEWLDTSKAAFTSSSGNAGHRADQPLPLNLKLNSGTVKDALTRARSERQVGEPMGFKLAEVKTYLQTFRELRRLAEFKETSYPLKLEIEALLKRGAEKVGDKREAVFELYDRLYAQWNKPDPEMGFVGESLTDSQSHSIRDSDLGHGKAVHRNADGSLKTPAGMASVEGNARGGRPTSVREAVGSKEQGKRVRRIKLKAEDRPSVEPKELALVKNADQNSFVGTKKDAPLKANITAPAGDWDQSKIRKADKAKALTAKAAKVEEVAETSKPVLGKLDRESDEITINGKTVENGEYTAYEVMSAWVEDTKDPLQAADRVEAAGKALKKAGVDDSLIEKLDDILFSMTNVPAEDVVIIPHNKKLEAELREAYDHEDVDTGGRIDIIEEVAEINKEYADRQRTLLHSSEVTPATAVVEADAHKAADAVTMHWSSDAPSVEFAPTFSGLPKEVQNSVKKDQQGKAKAVFHPDSNSIWVILDKHVNQADVEESLYHEGGHWGTLTELGKDAIAALDRSFNKLGVPMMSKIAKEHSFEKQFAADLKEYNSSNKTTEDRARLVAELLAGVAQKKPYRSWPQKLKDAVKELVGQFRNWLKKNGYVELSKLNETDVMYLVAQGNKRLVSGGQNVKGLPSFLMTLSTEIHNALGKEGIAATHDSPIRHEGKFNWREHKGKGEGNASFGAGTYLSTANGVHKSYKDQFTAAVKKGVQATYNARFVEDPNQVDPYMQLADTLIARLEESANFMPEWVDDFYNAFQKSIPMTEKYMGDHSETIYADKSQMKPFDDALIKEFEGYSDEVAMFMRDFNNSLTGKTDYSVKGFSPAKSPTYHVTVNAKPEELLDWDAPLSEQSDLVKKALKAGDVDITKPLYKGVTALQRKLNDKRVDPTGQQVYAELVRVLGSQAKASDYLQSLGIVGHKYAAAGGRNDKFPNYVIYDDSRIETNYVHFNSQTPNTKRATKEEIAQARKELEEALGDTVDAAFVPGKKLNGDSGDWRPGLTRNAIRVAISSDVVGTTRHESLHEFFDILKKHGDEHVRKLLEKVATNKLIMQQMERLLAKHPKALEQLRESPEEAVAYMYQFWRAGLLKMGPEATTFFEKVKQFFSDLKAKITGAVRDERHAEMLMAAFAKGAVKDKAKRDDVVKALNKLTVDHNNAAEKVGEFSKKYAKALQLVYTAEGMVELTKNKHMIKLAEMINQKSGAAMTKGDGWEGTFFDAKARQNAYFQNKLTNILDHMHRDDVELLREALATGDTPKIERIEKAVAEMKALNEELMDYIDTRNISRLDDDGKGGKVWKKVERRKDFGMPQIWDTDVIAKDPDSFKADLIKHHMKELERIAAQANEEIASFHKGAGQYANLGPAAKAEVDKKTDEFEKSGKLMAKVTYDKVTPEQVAEAIIVRVLMSNGKVDIEESTSELGITPLAASVNRRSLSWINPQEFDKYKQKDLLNIYSSYIAGMTKRGEFTARFGHGGEVIRDQTDLAFLQEMGGDDLVRQAKVVQPIAAKAWAKARAEAGDAGQIFDEPYPTLRLVGNDLHRTGVGEEQFNADLLKASKSLEHAVKAIQAMEGTLGMDVNPSIRDLNSWLMTYQNVRLLPFSLFTSLSDVVGLALNGGTMKDAWEAFVRGMREVKMGVVNDSKSMDDAAKRAEMWGAVDAISLNDTIGQGYGSMFMTGAARNISNKFFKKIGMESWNRAMRISAATVAERMLVGWANGKLDTSNASEMARVERLYGKGFKPSDIKLDAEGMLDVKDPANQAAVTRFVNDAVLRPNAAMRPIWGSDAHYASFFHLKSFTYAMHKMWLEGALNEAKLGNYKPAMVLLSVYLPMGIAAAAAKEMLIPGDEPAWMQGGLDDYLSYGVSKAGLLGVPQMIGGAWDSGFTDLAGPSVSQVRKALVNYDNPLKTLAGALPGGGTLQRYVGE